MPFRLIHITPELPPTVGGVADYTAILTNRLVEEFGDKVEPVLVHAGRSSSSRIQSTSSVVDLAGECSANALSETIEKLATQSETRSVVLLEYSGYGYAKRGTPIWIVQALRRVCGDEGVPLVTIFHETNASGPIWSSAMWLSPVQSLIARYIVRLSEGVMTTHPTVADQLQEFGRGQVPVQMSPAFSNVGEPAERPLIEERPNHAVIFGGTTMKGALYGRYSDLLKTCLKFWGVERLMDVGPTGSYTPITSRATVEIHGVLPAERIQELLLNARWGILHYPAAYATKSGVMGSYMAHGLVPVVVAPGTQEGLLVPHEHYIPVSSVSEELPPVNEAKSVGEVAAKWYSEHGHSRRAANTVYKLLASATS